LKGAYRRRLLTSNRQRRCVGTQAQKGQQTNKLLGIRVAINGLAPIERALFPNI